MTGQREIANETDADERGESGMQPGDSLFGSTRLAIEGRLDRVVVELTDPGVPAGDAVHDSRKAIKRSRGLLRLVRDSMDRATYRELNRGLRDAARALAGLRDATIRLETFDANRDLFSDRVARGVLTLARECLASDFAAAYPEGNIDQAVIPEIHAAIGSARRVLAGWEAGLSARYPNGGGAQEELVCIARGLSRVYRRGRNGMRASSASGDFKEFHEWRKRVKYLRYQLEHLGPLSPDAIGEMTARLRQVDECLGDAHDLWVLGNFIEAHAACCPDREQREIFVGLTDKRRRDLDARALLLGAPLYAEKPKAFVARIESHWSGS